MNHSKLSPSDEYKTGGRSALFILIVCTLLYMVNYMDRQVFAVVLQPMKAELGLTDTQCGLAQTIFILGMAFFSFPVAYLVDRWSRSRTIGIMALLWSFFTFLTGLARNFTTLIIPRSLVGMGESGFTAGGVALISAAYPPEKRARVLGIFNIGMALGAAIGMIVGGIISAGLGWRWAFYIFAMPGVILGGLAFLMRDYKTTARTSVVDRSENFVGAIASLFRIRSLCLYFIGYGVLCFMTVSVLVWAPALMMRLMNISEAKAGMIVGGWGLMAIIGAPLGGWLADFWQKKNGKGRLYLPALASVLAAVILIIMVLFRFGSVAIGLGFIYGILSVIGSPALNAVSQDVVPARHKGLSMGMAVFAAYMFGGAWGPSVVGIISDALGGGANGLLAAMLFLSVAGFAAGLILWLAARTYEADMKKVASEKLLSA